MVVVSNTATKITTVVTPISSTSTQVVFAVPAVESGTYNVRVRSDPIGETNGYTVKVNAQMTGASPGSVSVKGGRVTVSGRGLPERWPHPSFILKMTQAGQVVKPKIVSTSATAMVFDLPESSHGTVFAWSMKSPQNNWVSASVTARDSHTPAMSLSTTTSA